MLLVDARWGTSRWIQGVARLQGILVHRWKNKQINAVVGFSVGLSGVFCQQVFAFPSFTSFTLYQNGFCHVNSSELTAQIQSYTNVTSGDALALKLALFKNGPVAVSIDASHRSFVFYSYGVYYEPACGEFHFTLFLFVLLLHPCDTFLLSQAAPLMTWTTPCSRWGTATSMGSHTGWSRTRGPPTGVMMATSSCRWRTITVASPLMPHMLLWHRFDQSIGTKMWFTPVSMTLKWKWKCTGFVFSFIFVLNFFICAFQTY